MCLGFTYKTKGVFTPCDDPYVTLKERQVQQKALIRSKLMKGQGTMIGTKHKHTLNNISLIPASCCFHTQVLYSKCW